MTDSLLTSFGYIHILAGCALLFLLIQLVYLRAYGRIPRHNRRQTDSSHFLPDEELPPLSIVLCTHNEAEKLKTLVPTLLAQDYPQYELIVVNYASTDETEDVLTLLEEQHSNLYHSFIPAGSQYLSPKKLAQTVGIKAAKHEWIVFTETDSHPVSNRWLRLLSRNFTLDTQLVLGYADFPKARTLSAHLQAFGNLLNSLRFLGSALAKRPYMGTGRNMAYRKSLFFDHKGFSKHLHLLRGEDDLFVNEVATATNTRVETHPDARVCLTRIPSMCGWHEEQRHRLISTRHFRSRSAALWRFDTATRQLFLTVCAILAVCALLQQAWWMFATACVLFLLHTGLRTQALNSVARSLGSEWRFYTSPFFLQAYLTMQGMWLRLRTKPTFIAQSPKHLSHS